MYKFKSMILEKKSTYKFRNLVGGFSDGVSVAITDNPGVVRVSVNIYGGGEDTSALRYRVPDKIKNYQVTYIKTATSQQQITNDSASRLVAYKQDIKTAVSARLLPILQQFDEQCKVAVGKAIAEVNKKYGGVPQQGVSQKQTPPQPRSPAPQKTDNLK